MIFNLSRDRLAHAYILEGTDDGARVEVLNRFVRSILCKEATNDEPCNSCPDCLKINARTHEDVIYMKQSKESGYTVDDARDFISRLSMSSYGERRIGIIEDGDLLREDVQNKLLKTIEEPYPGTVIIISLRNRLNMLETVRSRCILLRADVTDATGDMSGSLEDFLLVDPKDVEFYEFRKYIDKNIKAREQAMKYLDELEVLAHESMLEGDLGSINVILRVEDTRKDIIRGMGYKQALKRLYLELAQVK